VATIRTTCPVCGDVEVESADVVVRVCSATSQGSYVFSCPACADDVTKAAPARIIDLLVANGVPMTRWDPPAELLEVHTGAPISYDDLLEFHFEVHSRGWLRRMIESVPSGPAE
jgi:rRNA maturation protein Nop10